MFLNNLTYTTTVAGASLVVAQDVNRRCTLRDCREIPDVLLCTGGGTVEIIILGSGTRR